MAPQETPGPPTDVQSTPAVEAGRTGPRGVVVTMPVLMGFFAAALVVFGSFGPWVNAGPIEVSGIRGDGVITLIAAGVGLLVVGFGRWHLVAVISALVAASTAIHGIAAIGSVSDDNIFALSIGWGVIACLLGSLGLLVWALATSWGRTDRRVAYAGTALASAVLLVVVTLAISGAYSDGSTGAVQEASVPAKDASSDAVSSVEAESSPDPQPPESDAPVGIGGQVRLSGANDLEMMATVERVVDPVYGSEYDTPASGKRYVAVELRLTNTGTVPYSDSPSNGASMTFGDDREATASLLTGGPCEGGFASSSKIAVGAKRRGCIVFEVPKANTIKTFQLTLDSGFADQTGIWNIRSANGQSQAGRSSSPSGSTPVSGRTPGASRTRSAGSATTACDQNISAGAGTTCDFANSVFKKYAAKVQSGGGSDKAVTAYNSAAGLDVDVFCTYDGYDVVSCGGSSGESVTFPKWAADVY